MPVCGEGQVALETRNLQETAFGRYDTLLFILMFGNFVCFCAYFVTATFDYDLKGYIQKSLVDSIKLRTERILFCHPSPSSMASISAVNQVELLTQQFNFNFNFFQTFFWGLLSTIPSLKEVLQYPIEAFK